MYRHCNTTASFVRHSVCSILTCLALASIVLPTTVGAANTQITVLLKSDFGADEDANGDGWPDAWKRIFDREHPKYISISTKNRVNTDLESLQQNRRFLSQLILAFEQGRRPGDIVPEKTPPKLDEFLDATLMNRCLEVQMNGGAALIESSTFPIDRRFTYRVSAELKCEQLDDFAAQLTLVGINELREEIVLGASAKLSGSSEWLPIRINNVGIQDNSIVSAKLRLEIKPTNFRALQGVVKLDTVRVLRLPKLTVSMDPPSQVIRAGQSLDVKCEITGLDRPVSRVDFLVLDADRQVKEKLQFEVKTESHPNQDNQQYIGTYQRSVEFLEAGYYELVISLDDSNRSDFHQTNPIVVLPAKEDAFIGSNPRFGLSIDQAGRALSWEEVARIATQLGLGNLKIPIWFDITAKDEVSPLVSTLDAINTQQITPIGILDRPPPRQLSQFPGDVGSNLLEVLDLPTIWQPLLDPVFQRITLHVRQFQIGWDSETSLIYDNKLPSIVQNLHAKLATYDPEANLVLPCDITSKHAGKTQPNIARYQLFTNPGLLGGEIRSFSEALGQKAANRWVSISAVDSDVFGRESSIVDIAEKMLAVVDSQFSAGFFTRTSAKELFDEKGRPGMLYLPVRSVAKWLRNVERQETIELAEGHRGTLLFRGEQVDLLLFPPDQEHKPQRFWLGENLKAEDVWGRSVEIAVDQSAAGLPILVSNNRWPMLIQNINESLIRWQSAVELISKNLVMTTAGSATLQVEIKNKENIPISGTIRLVAPEVFHQGFVDMPIMAEPMETVVLSADVQLRSDVAEGDTPLQMVATLAAGKSLNFELQRVLHIGLPGIRITSKTQITEADQLLIDVSIENQSEKPLSFDMMLFVPERPRQRLQIVGVQGKWHRQFVIENAKQLSSQPIRLRCEQIGTGLTINHVIKTDQSSTD